MSSSSNEARDGREADAIYQIASAALTVAPDNPTEAIELMLTTVVYFTAEALKLSRKDACDFVDAKLALVFEKFAARAAQ
jgi:hypothetical protein